MGDNTGLFVIELLTQSPQAQKLKITLASFAKRFVNIESVCYNS